MKEIIVVEGKDDTRRLIEVFGKIDTIETNGSAISTDTLELIKKAQKLRGVIVFTDPDFPGQKIRQTIMDYVPNAKHAFITKKDGISKKRESVGIEHASDEAIKQALRGVMTPATDTNQTIEISRTLLCQLGLIGQSYSNQLRQEVSHMLGIGHVNAKQLEKRLIMFNIKKDDLIHAVKQCKKERNNAE